MNKKALCIFSLCAIASLSVSGLLVFGQEIRNANLADPIEYTMVLDSTAEIVEKDNGYLHQTVYKNNTIDLIGYDENNSGFATISQKTYGNAVTYRGMIYNRAIINGLKSIKITYSGDALHYVFTEYLMEDMDFAENASNLITSGEDILANVKDGYFLVYTSGSTDITSMSIKYACDNSLGSTMIFNKNSTLAYARSTPTSTTTTDSYLEQVNRPSVANNYSPGETIKSGRSDTWYRWNGRCFKNSGVMGKQFDFQTTIMGNISQVIDPDNYFNFSVWPHFTCASDDDWQQVYVGNDNYEPLGKDSPDKVHTDHYADFSYSGRFITAYVYDDIEDDYVFADPDNTYVMGSTTTTLRDAYDAYTLPFWNIRFSVHTENDGEHDRAYCDVYVNGFKIDTADLFHYTEGNAEYWYDGTDLTISELHMHCVNYGNPDGSAKAPYQGMFTYPRLMD